MDSSLILSNVFNYPVLFISTGMTAVFLTSDLGGFPPIPQLFSLGSFLISFAIGFRGAHELHKFGLTPFFAPTLMAAVRLAVSIYSFFILRLKLDLYNAATVSATYDSISAVTFVTASSFLSGVNVDFGVPMVAALALMESPAIIVDLLLRVRVFAHRRNSQESQKTLDWSDVSRESWLNGWVFLSLGSLLVGQVWPWPLFFRLTSPSAFQFTFN